MGVIAKLTAEQLVQELQRAESVLDRLRSKKAPWESVSIAEAKVRSLRARKPVPTEWVLAKVTLRQRPVPATLRAVVTVTS